MRTWILVLVPLLLLCACGHREAAAPEAPSALKGTLKERLDVPPYSYLRLETPSGERWAAVPRTELQPGAQVEVLDATAMRDWESPQLKRRFELLFLGRLEGQAPAGHGAALPKGMGLAAPKAQGGLKLPRAEGAEGRTIAELYAQRGALMGRPVALRGQVVKVSRGLTVQGVAGANWVHLQDGTGDEARGEHDVVVTTDALPEVGQVVLARGVARPNPMAGPGPENRTLMVQEARLAK